MAASFFNGLRSSRAERRAKQELQRRDKVLRSMTDRASELVLLRHGETDWNLEGLLQGQLCPGPPLNQRGVKQAQAAAERLRGEQFDAVYSSDLLRCMTTAEMVVSANGGSKVTPRCDLRERRLGVLEGSTLQAAARQWPAAVLDLQSDDPHRQIQGGGESAHQLQARVEEALASIAAAHPGQRVLVVTHGGFLHCVQCAATGRASGGRAGNCSISTVRVEAGQGAGQRAKLAVMSWDDISHLQGVGGLAANPDLQCAPTQPQCS